ncbi:MAG TPA: glycosyltransferase family 39 protein [Gaiellaceae bacterium]|nr:glycosyltransferase family 39 protein [Gaiellaceae bacterium]
MVGGLALLLGLVRLGGPSLWFDESYTVRQLGKPYLEQIEGYQPLYYWLQKTWTSLAGTSEWALRLPSVLGAVLACGLLVLLARRLVGRQTALLAGVLLATSPFFVKWSQQARGYTLLVALGLASTFLLVRALERGTRSAWAAYGMSAALVLVWHALAGLFVLVGQAGLVVLRRERFLPHGLLAVALVVGLGMPWVGQIAVRTDAEGSETDWIPFPAAETVARAIADAAGAAGAGVALALLGLWLLRRAGRAQLALWLGAWAIAPFLVAVAVSTVRPVFLDRYFLSSAPAFALLAACALTSVRGRARAVLALAVGGATLLGLASWYSTGRTGNWMGEDWRRAARTVSERRAEAGAVVVVPWWAHSAAEYYGLQVQDTSTARSVWVLRWSEEGGRLDRGERGPLGLGDHRLVESLPFGSRLTAQLWQRP